MNRGYDGAERGDGLSNIFNDLPVKHPRLWS